MQISKSNSIAMNLNLLILEDRHQSEEKAMFTVYQCILDKQKNKSDVTLAAEIKKSELVITNLINEFQIKLNAAAEEYKCLLSNGSNVEYNNNSVAMAI